MPYSDIEEKREQQRRWYRNHRQKVIAEREARRQKNREWFQAYKATLKCERCPEDEACCLDFHHRDSADKDGMVSKMVLNGCSVEKIMAEIAKCDVLCANCHRKVHKWHK